MKNKNRLRRAQLDRFFETLTNLNLRIPKLGWVKEIRDALGLSMQDLAERSGVIKQRIERIEKDEIAGKVTLETMQKIAEALECEFVYFLVPKVSLEQTLKDQAYKVAESVSQQVGTTMELEAQGTSSKSRKQLVERIAQDLLNKEDRKIWRAK